MPNGSDLRVTPPSNSNGSKLLTFPKPVRCWIYMVPIGRPSWDHSCLLRLSIRPTIVKIIKTISVLSVKFLRVPWNTSCGNALRTGFIIPFLSTRFNFGSDGASVALPHNNHEVVSHMASTIQNIWDFRHSNGGSNFPT